jgi:hypothetical protein
MPRGPVAALAGLAALVALGLSLHDDQHGAAQAPPTTVAAESTSVTTVPRGSALAGSVAKPQSEEWSVRRMVTLTVLGVVALVGAGFVYGRIRSTPPRHPDLL